MGRIVITHSTYIEGLIPILRKIAVHEDVKTVTPGRIRTSKGRSEFLGLKVSTRILGGYKVIAKKGKSTQEVFIVTKMTKESLEKHIQNHIKEKREKI